MINKIMVPYSSYSHSPNIYYIHRAIVASTSSISQLGLVQSLSEEF